MAHNICRLKCDRQNPCSSCLKRADAASCNYSESSRNSRDSYAGVPKTSEAQLRLQKLEELVTDLMQTSKQISENGSQKIPPGNLKADRCWADGSVHSPPYSFKESSGGHLNQSGSEMNYVGATHWATILENVGGPIVLFASCS